uniref:Coiled-coil SMC6 And NSE5 INteracting (CANIN) domain-containing protein n=1 Tax=Eptatretus burgeri TaxID=7764 RepID=A0A8C4Q533_EPTBU
MTHILLEEMALINCAEKKRKKLYHGNSTDCSTMDILCTNEVLLTGKKLTDTMAELDESFEAIEASGCDVGSSSKQVQDDDDQDDEVDEEEEKEYAAIKYLLHMGGSSTVNRSTVIASPSAQSPCSTFGSTEITTSSKVRPWLQVRGDLQRILASRVRSAELSNEEDGTLKKQLQLVEENAKQEKTGVEEFEDGLMIQESRRMFGEGLIFKDIPDWCPGEEVLNPRAWMLPELDPELLQVSETLRLVLELHIVPDQWPNETVVTKQDHRFHGNPCIWELLFRIMATSAHKDTCRQAFQTLCGLNCYARCLWPFPQWVPTFFQLIRTLVTLGATPASLFPAVGFHPVFPTDLHRLDILADQHGVSSPGKNICNPPGLYFLAQYLTLCIHHEINVFSKREHVLLVALCARLMLQRGMDLETLCALRQLLSLLLTKFDSWLSKCSELAGCLSHLSDNHHNLLELVLSLPCQAPRDRELQVLTGLGVISRLLLGDKSTVPSKFKLSLLVPLLSKMRPSALQHLIQSTSNEETNVFEPYLMKLLEYLQFFVLEDIHHPHFLYRSKLKMLISSMKCRWRETLDSMALSQGKIYNFFTTAKK